jgi:hypothetical protein
MRLSEQHIKQRLAGSKIACRLRQHLILHEFGVRPDRRRWFLPRLLERLC